MVEVTSEMREVGMKAYASTCGIYPDGLALETAYLAMRAMEAKLTPGEWMTELRNRKPTAPVLRAEDQARGMDAQDGRLSPDERLSNRRLDALTALVRHLTTGYNSRDDDDYANLRRLIDALDAAR